MLTIWMMTGLCCAGTIFSLHFLVALHRERKRSWICYWLRLWPDSCEVVTLESDEEKWHTVMAA